MSKLSIREPTSCYHFCESYLNLQQIQRVLNHYQDYIVGALYILHDKDTYQLLNDYEVRRSELVEKHNQLKQEINLLDISIKDAERILKVREFDSAEQRYTFRNMEVTQKKKMRTRLQKKYMNISDDITAIDNEANIAGCIKEPHYHILIKCYGSHTQSAVRKWFYRFRVTEIKPNDDGVLTEFVVNTNNAIVDSVSAARDYLTHKNEPEDSGKYYYSITDVVEFKGGWSCFNKVGRAVDDIIGLLDRINNGDSLRQLARDYGRDFVINKNKYKSFAIEMQAQEDKAVDIMANENSIIRRAIKDGGEDSSYYYDILDTINMASLVESITKTIISELSSKK